MQRPPKKLILNTRPWYPVYPGMPRRSLPLVTLILVVTNLWIYLLELVDGGQKACEFYGIVPARLDPAALLTYGFFHDPGNLAHIFGNMFFLAVFGALVEGALGHGRFLLLYGAAGVAGGLLHVLVAPGSAMPLVGASGAIFGLLAVAAVLRPRLLGFAVAFVTVNVYQAFFGGEAGVSFACHIGGFVVGFLAVAAMRLAGSEVLEVA